MIQRELETAKLADDLIGRTPLLDDILQAISRASQRLYVIQGAAGTGKSALSVGLARILRSDNIYGTRLLHHYLCNDGMTGERAKHAFISEIITACDDAQLPIGGTDERTSITDLARLFATMRTVKPAMTFILLIDGCDESSAITSLLTSEAISVMPSWIKIIVTTRVIPGKDWTLSQPSGTSGGVTTYQLDESSNQQSAVAAYIDARLTPILAKQFSISDTSSQQSICTSLARASGILFIYARLAIDAIQRRDIVPSPTAFDSLPYADINAFYHQSFARRWPLTSTGIVTLSYATVRIILEDMIVAQMGDMNVTLSEMTEDKVECTVDHIRGAINMLSPWLVIPTSSDTKSASLTSLSSYTFIHKSFTDWLSDSNNMYGINIVHGQRRAIIAYVLRSGPTSFTLQRTPLFYRALADWIGHDFTWQPLASPASSGDNSGYGTGAAVFYAFVILLTNCAAETNNRFTLLNLQSLIFAMEAERCRTADITASSSSSSTSSLTTSAASGHGFWSATDLTTCISLLSSMPSSSPVAIRINRNVLAVWITMMPERFVWPATTDKISRGLAPLARSDRITHIDDQVMHSGQHDDITTTIGVIRRIFNDDGVHTIRVTRADAVAKLRVRLATDLPSLTY